MDLLSGQHRDWVTTGPPGQRWEAGCPKGVGGWGRRAHTTLHQAASSRALGDLPLPEHPAFVSCLESRLLGPGFTDVL